MRLHKRDVETYHRRQKFDEPVEQYVMEMVNLAKKVFPDEDEKITVLRTKRGLVPDLIIYIGDCQTVNELAESAIENIRARDNQRHTRLPQFRGEFRGRGGNRPPKKFMGSGRGASRNYSNFQPHSSSGQYDNRTQSQSQDQQFRPRINSLLSQLTNRPFTMKCHTCNEMDHMARFCPQKGSGYNMAIGPNQGTSGTNMQQRRDTSYNNSGQQSSLNIQGRSRYPSGQDASQY